MLILRQKQFAKKDYESLSYFGKKALRKLRNSLAKELKRSRYSSELKESSRNKFINKFTSNKDRISTISNINKSNKLSELDSTREYINELKKDARKKAENITKRDKNFLNKAKYIGIPAATLGIVGAGYNNIYNKDTEEDN